MRCVASVTLATVSLAWLGSEAAAAVHESREGRTETLRSPVGNGRDAGSVEALLRRLSAAGVLGYLRKGRDEKSEALWSLVGEGPDAFSVEELFRHVVASGILGYLQEADVEPEIVLGAEEVMRAGDEILTAEAIAIEDDLGVLLPEVQPPETNSTVAKVAVPEDGIGVLPQESDEDDVVMENPSGDKNQAPTTLSVHEGMGKTTAPTEISEISEISQCSVYCCNWPDAFVDLTELEETWDLFFPSSSGVVACTRLRHGSNPAVADEGGSGPGGVFGEVLGYTALLEDPTYAETLPTCMADDVPDECDAPLEYPTYADTLPTCMADNVLDECDAPLEDPTYADTLPTCMADDVPDECDAPLEDPTYADTLPTYMADDVLDETPIIDDDYPHSVILEDDIDEPKTRTDEVVRSREFHEVKPEVVAATHGGWAGSTLALAVVCITTLALLGLSEARRVRESAAAARQLRDQRERSFAERDGLIRLYQEEQQRGVAARDDLIRLHQQRQQRAAAAARADLIRLHLEQLERAEEARNDVFRRHGGQLQRAEEARYRWIRHYEKEVRQLRQQLREEEDRGSYLEGQWEWSERRRVGLADAMRGVQGEEQRLQQQVGQQQQQLEQARQQRQLQQQQMAFLQSTLDDRNEELEEAGVELRATEKKLKKAKDTIHDMERAASAAAAARFREGTNAMVAESRALRAEMLGLLDEQDDKAAKFAETLKGASANAGSPGKAGGVKQGCGNLKTGGGEAHPSSEPKGLGAAKRAGPN